MNFSSSTKIGAVLFLSSLTLFACGNKEEETTPTPTSKVGANKSAFATALLKNPEGNQVGTVTFTEAQEKTQINLSVQALEPGFHGLHLHSVGKCEPNSSAPGDDSKKGNFLSAGGHLMSDSNSSHQHGGEGLIKGNAGDLPSILVNEDGTASMQVETDRINKDLLLKEGGTSVIIHEGSDNFAHIPERYAPEGPDEDTLKTGDAGARALCGVITQS